MLMYSKGHESNGWPLQTTSFPYNHEEDEGRQLGRCSICPAAKDKRTHRKCCQCRECVCKNHNVKTIQIKCDNCQKQSDKFHSHFSVLNYIFLSSKILCISLCIAAWETKNLNKSNFLSLSLAIKLRKKNVEKAIKEVWVQDVPTAVEVESFYCSITHGIQQFHT